MVEFGNGLAEGALINDGLLVNHPGHEGCGAGLVNPAWDAFGVIEYSGEGIVSEERAGRGASDTKGPMAAMLIALRELVETKRLPQETDIWFAGLMGEESGNEGVDFLMNSDFFPRQGVKLDFGIAGEPTDLKIVNRHKGALWLRITTHGRSCHGSRPDLGDNAILKARRVMDYLATELPAAYGGQEDPVLGRSTFSLNTIRGGTKVNIVPDLCHLEVDHRSLPGVSHDEVVTRVRQALPDCDVEVVSNRPGLNTPAENPYIQKLTDVLARRASSPPRRTSACPAPSGVERRAFLIGAPWFADCSVMAKSGVPAIAFGPGSIQQAHTKDEFIEMAELDQGVNVFREFLADLG